MILWLFEQVLVDLIVRELRNIPALLNTNSPCESGADEGNHEAIIDGKVRKMSVYTHRAIIVLVVWSF